MLVKGDIGMRGMRICYLDYDGISDTCAVPKFWVDKLINQAGKGFGFATYTMTVSFNLTPYPKSWLTG